MINFILRRLIQSLIVIIIVSLVVFIAVRLLPGDPILLYLSQQELNVLTEEDIRLIAEEFGLDKPLMVQYGNWIANLFQGDLGTSLFYSEKVSTLISERLPVTLHLGLLAFVLGAIFGITAGLISALRRGKIIDTLVTTLANIGVCVPAFWLGILLIYLFGLRLDGYRCMATPPLLPTLVKYQQAILPFFAW
jgi:peptide/nickel transport system permease protein